MTIIKSITIAFGFFTTIPVPVIDWKDKYMKYVPIVLPLVGVILGLLGYLILYALSLISISPLLKATVITIYFILITGGLHLDALMDTADAHYSRRDIKRKIEIMKDSRVGAFAVISLFTFLILKISIMNELLYLESLNYEIILIPIISRTIQPLILYNVGFATNEGLASMYGNLLNRNEQIYLWITLLIVSIVGYILISYHIFILIALSLISYLLYIRFANKQFGGITGDIIGAYLEILELMLFISVLIYNL